MFQRDTKIQNVIISSEDIRRLARLIYSKIESDLLQNNAAKFEISIDRKPTQSPGKGLDLLREGGLFDQQKLKAVRIYFSDTFQKREIEVALATQHQFHFKRRKNFLKISGPDQDWVDSVFNETKEQIASWKMNTQSTGSAGVAAANLLIGYGLIQYVSRVAPADISDAIITYSFYVQTHLAEFGFNLFLFVAIVVGKSQLALSYVVNSLLSSLFGWMSPALAQRYMWIFLALLLLFLAFAIWVFRRHKKNFEEMRTYNVLLYPAADKRHLESARRKQRLAEWLGKYAFLCAAPIIFLIRLIFGI